MTMSLSARGYLITIATALARPEYIRSDLYCGTVLSVSAAMASF